MPLQLSDDLFEHLTPPETVEWTLTDVHYPKDNPEPVVLQLKFVGIGSSYLKVLKGFAGKPLADVAERTERALRLFCKHVIAGWRNVLDEGKPAAFDPKFCAELLVRVLHARGQQGIEEMDSMMKYAMNPAAFRTPVVEATELGKE